jgi:hypothetical protein
MFGDLNFTLGACEIWGTIAHRDSLVDIFIQKIEEVGLFDIQPLKYSPTWRNMCTREDKVAKTLDGFLLFEDLLQENLRI